MKRTPTAPPELAGFRYLRHLGGGGFADVFEYVDTLGRHVAVKVLLSGLGQDRQRAFEDEARRMAQLSNHPSIVSIHQAGAAPDGRPFLVMEYCPPPELWQRVRERPMSVAKTLEIGIQVAGAVESAHRLDILHRDIKPANILFTEFDHPALTDFGIAASTLAGESGQTEGLSVPWAPPEQLTTGTPMGAPGDVYALAATLWTCLVGRHPFYLAGGPNDSFHLSKRIKHDPVPPTGRDDVLESLERVLAIAMDKRPEARYRTAREFALALQGIQAELHLPITANDIREQAVPRDTVYEEDDGLTKFRPIVIDPEGFAPPAPLPTPRTPARDDRQARRPMGQTAAGDAAHPGDPNARPAVFEGGPAWRAPHGLPADGDGPTGDVTGGRLMTDPRLLTDDGLTAAASSRTADHTVLHERNQPDAVAAPDDRAQTDGAGSTGGPGRRARARALPTVGVVAAVLAIAALIVGIVRLGGQAGAPPPPTTHGSTRPADPIEGIVPPLKGKATRGGGARVVVTVENPSPQAGDSYLYRLLDPAAQSAYQRTEERLITLDAPPGRACVELVLRRSTGRSSAPISSCTEG